MSIKPIRVLMIPDLSKFDNEESGIKRVIENYHKHADRTNIEYVTCSIDDESQYDIFAVHAGTTNRYPKRNPIVAILHGLYWTADYPASMWEWRANANVVESVRRAMTITVPSNWVAETIRRDIRVNPYIVSHGIDADDWDHEYENEGYVLWNKNRAADVCDPTPMVELAKRAPNLPFVTTFTTGQRPNIHAIGLQPHAKMKSLVQRAGIFLSSTKETFGIGTLEAMASGVPVLGFAHGGNLDLVEHGVTGYLASPGDIEGLAEGLVYCHEHRDTLGQNAKIAARKWTWEKATDQIAEVFQQTLDKKIYLERPFRIKLAASPPGAG